MSRLQLLIVGGFVLAFLAGGAAGLLTGSHPPERPRGGRHGPARLSQELGLSPEQAEQMHRIWSEVMEGPAMRELWRRRRELRRQRTEALEGLLSDAQRQQYEQIQADFNRRSEQIGKETHELFEQAVARTKAILTPAQAAKYEQLRQQWHRKPGPSGRRRQHGRLEGPSSRPGTPGAKMSLNSPHPRRSAARADRRGRSGQPTEAPREGDRR